MLRVVLILDRHNDEHVMEAVLVGVYKLAEPSIYAAELLTFNDFLGEHAVRQVGDNGKLRWRMDEELLTYLLKVLRNKVGVGRGLEYAEGWILPHKLLSRLRTR